MKVRVTKETDIPNTAIESVLIKTLDKIKTLEEFNNSAGFRDQTDVRRELIAAVIAEYEEWKNQTYSK